MKKMTIEQEMELWELLFDYTEELEELDRTQMIGCDGGLLVEAYEDTAFELGETGYSKETINSYAEIYAVNFC